MYVQHLKSLTVAAVCSIVDVIILFLAFVQDLIFDHSCDVLRSHGRLAIIIITIIMITPITGNPAGLSRVSGYGPCGATVINFNPLPKSQL